MGFCTPNQVKQIISKYLQDSGRGGYQTGVVSSVKPLKIRLNNKIEITEQSLYISDAAIGLSVKVGSYEKAVLRNPLKVGDGVLLITQPRADGRQMYILLDLIQKYREYLELTVLLSQSLRLRTSR